MMRNVILLASFLISLFVSVINQSTSGAVPSITTTACSVTCNTMSHPCECYLDGYVDCKLKNLTSIPSPMPACARRISISRNRITDIGIRDFEGPVNLLTLEISNENIREISSGVFYSLSALQSLSLPNNHIRKVEECAFKGLHSLESLRLSDNNITTLDARSFEGLSTLQSLHLDRNQIASLEPTLLRTLSNLQYLHLQSNALTQIPHRALNGLSRLVSINIYNNQFGKLDVQWFQDVNNLTLLVGQNPWNCTCALKKDYSYILSTFNTEVHCPFAVQEIAGSFFNRMCIVCSYPIPAKGQILSLLPLSNFTDCGSNETDTSTSSSMDELVATTQNPDLFTSDGESVASEYCAEKIDRLKTVTSQPSTSQVLAMTTQPNVETTSETSDLTTSRKLNIREESTKPLQQYTTTAASAAAAAATTATIAATAAATEAEHTQKSTQKAHFTEKIPNTTTLNTTNIFISDDSKSVPTSTIIIIIVVILVILISAIVVAICVIRKSDQKMLKVDPPLDETEMQPSPSVNKPAETETNGL